jgi:hypothetical protein
MRIYFCDLCNESVPQATLDEGTAVLRKGRVICASCEAAMSSHRHGPDEPGAAPVAVGGTPEEAQAAPIEPLFTAQPARPGEDTTIVEPVGAPTLARPAPRSTSGGGLGVGLAAVALIFAVGSMAFLLDQRGQFDRHGLQLIEEVRRSRTTFQDESRSMEARLTETVQQAAAGVADTERAVGELGGRVAALDADRDDALAGLREELRSIGLKVQELDVALGRVAENESELASLGETTANLHDQVLRMTRRLDDVEVTGDRLLAAAPAEPRNEQPQWFPLLADLESQNSGKRWQAVQSLGATRDPAVAEHLSPMLKDPDIFVRMATARILGDLEAAIGIPALIDALEDPEASVREAAVVSLRSITGRSFKFDPGGKEVERAKRVKAWRDWWKKAQSDFLEQA